VETNSLKYSPGILIPFSQVEKNLFVLK